jgi:gluconate 2-dehydrogenase gamma chain
MRLHRRHFLTSASAGLGAAWLTSNWPAALAASAYARSAAVADPPPKFKFFTEEQALEVSAITSRIIPSDASPGAREAGAVYFIDAGLVTIAPDAQPIYRDGLLQFQEGISTMFPGTVKFSMASAEQQDKFLHEFDVDAAHVGRRARYVAGGKTFFETIREHTVAAFLIDPESEYAANRSGFGWELIGRDPAHSFQPPFGFYDKDYPGWSAPPADKSK